MDFLVEFEVDVPAGTSETEVKDRERAEAVAATKLADEGYLLRVWKRPLSTGETNVLGLYRAESETELDGLLSALPLYEWMTVRVTGLERHPNDPAAAQETGRPAARSQS
jgi:muconolactone D-isomerase